MGLLHHLENPTGTPNPCPNSKPPSNKPWMTTKPFATIAAWPCTATIATPAPIATGYGEIRLQTPVFRCGQCRHMAGGMTLLGQEMRYQRFSKKP